jgi:hypothetical protein
MDSAGVDHRDRQPETDAARSDGLAAHTQQVAAAGYDPRHLQALRGALSRSLSAAREEEDKIQGQILASIAKDLEKRRKEARAKDGRGGPTGALPVLP